LAFLFTYLVFKNNNLSLGGNVMTKRPDLDKDLDSNTFKNFYYLKEELVDFCRKNGLQATGNKIEITDRIAHYLDTNEKTFKTHKYRKTIFLEDLTLDSVIENNFVCSEKHREFYKKHIGNTFSFNVTFQKWLKRNSGKTYKDSIKAYCQIVEDKKKNKTTIDEQFEYNTYIRDFFNDNKDKNLKQAIACWKYKKSLQGHNKYEKEDLEILTNE